MSRHLLASFRHKHLDLPALEVFVAVAEDLSMSSAAARLGMTQSAVSQSVRQLEEQLGVVLFDRARRPLQLTAGAALLLNRSKALLAESAQIRSQMLEANLGIYPQVSIGLVDSFAATCGPTFIKRLIRKTARLAVRTGLTPFQGEQLMAREFDIVITTDACEWLEGKIDRCIFSEDFIVLTPKGAAATRYSREGLHELALAMPLIRFNSQSHLGAQVETLLRRLGVKAAPRLEVDTADTLVAMVAAGLGWAITTPCCLVQGMQHASMVRIGLLENIHASRSIYLVGRVGEHEKLFREAYRAALFAVRETLLPAISGLAPGAGGLVRLAEGQPEQ